MRLTTCLLSLFLTLPVCAHGAETLVLNTSHSAPRSRPDGSGYEDRIVAEAFRSIGLAVRLVHLPSERALQNVNQGIDDGNFSRIAGLEAHYQNLVMVPEPVDEFLFTAFTKIPSLHVQRWDDLKTFNVGLITGWKIVEANTRDARSVTRVKDEEALFALLDRGRADVVVADLYAGLELLRSNGYQGIRALRPPLERRDMHLYLNKRHVDLVPRLAAALRDMKRDGTIARLHKALPALDRRGKGAPHRLRTEPGRRPGPRQILFARSAPLRV